MVSWEAGKELVMEEVQLSPPLPYEIRLKVVSTSLCRSDISAWESQVFFFIVLTLAPPSYYPTFP